MDKMKEIRRFFLLQVNDALFPIGGYSHSQGLETYIQKGIVHDEKTAAEYISRKLKLNLACTDLLGVRLAYEYARKENVAALDTLEEILGASRIPMEQREASRKMGSRFTKTICKLPQENIPMEKRKIFEEYLEARKGKPVSHCCAYGVFCAALGIEEEETLYHYLYAQTSAMVTNCVKTIPLSQSAGQDFCVDVMRNLKKYCPVFWTVQRMTSVCRLRDLISGESSMRSFIPDFICRKSERSDFYVICKNRCCRTGRLRKNSIDRSFIKKDGR